MAFCYTDSRLMDESGVTYLGNDPTRSLPTGERQGWRKTLGLSSTPERSELRHVLYETLTTQADPNDSILCPPLMPESDGVLRFGLFGFEKRITPAEPEWSGVRDVLRRIYRQTREEVLGGLATPNLHRKMLTVWLEKFRLPVEEYLQFIPIGLPDEKPIFRETTISDNFNRADQTGLGSSSEGWSWSLPLGNWNIVSNTAELQDVTTVSLARADSDLSSTDHYGQADVVVCPSPEQGGPAARFSASAATCYIAMIAMDADTLNIQKFEAGTPTQLDGVAITPSVPEAYRVQCNGSNIKAFQAGTERLSITDTSITTGTRCGMYGHWAATKVQLDNFSASDLAAGGMAFKPWVGRGMVKMGMGRR